MFFSDYDDTSPADPRFGLKILFADRRGTLFQRARCFVEVHVLPLLTPRACARELILDPSKSRRAEALIVAPRKFQRQINSCVPAADNSKDKSGIIPSTREKG